MLGDLFLYRLTGLLVVEDQQGEGEPEDEWWA